jgi:hypothetical protein
VADTVEHETVEIDLALLKSEIQKTYAAVLKEPDLDFIFPTGRGWAGDLDPPELDHALAGQW